MLALVQEMDATGKVDPAYRKVKAEAAPDASVEQDLSLNAEAAPRVSDLLRAADTIARTVDDFDLIGWTFTAQDAARLDWIIRKLKYLRQHATVDESLLGDSRLTCEACGEPVDPDDAESPLYECGESGTRYTRENSADSDGNRCPDCNKFGARVADYGCPACGAGERVDAAQQ